jgi:hypothetical protein
LIDTIYASIEKRLSDQEKKILFLFLEWNGEHNEEIAAIIEKIRKDLDNENDKISI